MKRLLVLLLLIASSCSGPQAHQVGSDREADVQEITLAILRHEATLPRERNWTCVSSRTDGVAFDRERESLQRLRSEHPLNPADAIAVKKAIRHLSDRQYDWRKPATATVHHFGSGMPLEGTEGLRLSKAAVSIIQAPAQPSPMARIKPGWVPVSLRSWGRFGLCASLSLSAPAFSKDLAFVETAYVCGGFCGYGGLYALSRNEEGWEIVAMAMTWVS